MREKVLAYCIKYDGDWNKIAKAISDEEKTTPVEYLGQYVTVFDEHYPSKFRSIRFPPWIVFYHGDLSLCEQPSLAIVGSRMANSYGEMCTEKICEYIQKQKVVISGLARGIDSIAHRASLSGKTIGILGCGIDIIYPQCNFALFEKMKRKHLIISEYPPGTPPLKYHFPWRNRLIAALGDKLVVVQAKIKSGTAITANEAIELGKEVFCVPHRLFDVESEGGNELIYNGASILVHFDDLI